jgi:hypothetical protein
LNWISLNSQLLGQIRQLARIVHPEGGFSLFCGQKANPTMIRRGRRSFVFDVLIRLRSLVSVRKCCFLPYSFKPDR